MATTSFENDKDPSLPRDLMSVSLDLINKLNSKQSVLDKTVRDKDINKDSTYGKQPSLEYRFMHSPKGSLRYIRHPDDPLTGQIQIPLPDPAEFGITDTEFESEVDPFDEIDIDKPNTSKAHHRQADINQARIRYYEENVLGASMEISDAEVLRRIDHSTDIGSWEALGSQPPSIDLTAEDGGFEFDSDDSDDEYAQSLHSNNPDNPKSAKSWYQNIFAKKSEFPCSSPGEFFSRIFHPKTDSNTEGTDPTLSEVVSAYLARTSSLPQQTPQYFQHDSEPRVTNEAVLAAREDQVVDGDGKVMVNKTMEDGVTKLMRKG